MLAEKAARLFLEILLAIFKLLGIMSFVTNNQPN